MLPVNNPREPRCTNDVNQKEPEATKNNAHKSTDEDLTHIVKF